jgi:hypothetical protein
VKLKRPSASTGHGTGVLQERSLGARLQALRFRRRFRLSDPDPEEQRLSRRPRRQHRAGSRHRVRLEAARVRNQAFASSVPW